MTPSQWPSWLPLREQLAPMSPYGAPQIDLPVRLNTNENPYSLHNEVTASIASEIEKVLTDLNRYPDRDAVELRSALAQYINQQSGTHFEKDSIWAANGSNEILQSLFLAIGGDALGFLPSYSMHPLIAKITNSTWHDGQRKPDFTLDIESATNHIKEIKPALTFITTPNNPTGTALTLAEISDIARAVGSVGGILVVDEAYAEFSEVPSAVTLIEKFPHIVVVRTMSKAFSFAGARVGYLIAHPAVINAMLLVRLPYHLSALTQAAARAALSQSEHLLKNVSTIRQSRDEVARQLVNLGLSVVPSQANFLLFTGFKRPASEIWRELVDQGILIRDIGISGYLRVTIGTPTENAQFITALTQSIAK